VIAAIGIAPSPATATWFIYLKAQLAMQLRGLNRKQNPTD